MIVHPSSFIPILKLACSTNGAVAEPSTHGVEGGANFALLFRVDFGRIPEAHLAWLQSEAAYADADQAHWLVLPNLFEEPRCSGINLVGLVGRRWKRYLAGWRREVGPADFKLDCTAAQMFAPQLASNRLALFAQGLAQKRRIAYIAFERRFLRNRFSFVFGNDRPIVNAAGMAPQVAAMFAEKAH